ncbi:MAG TPA: Holliday junction branch migration protein RuvA [Bacteroidota bacterium]|nr:Holliday junction branch migration protein RuvA [Bacteroidota bacterium]
MIASLTGILKAKSPTEALVDVNGVGYSVNIPLSTFERLDGVNSTVTLFTYLHVREDALQLFGFASEEERYAFKLLISVNGIGPKIAQGILSGMSVSELRSNIASSNIGALISIPGVGRKTAERLVVELRDKIGKFEPALSTAAASPAEARTEALLALTSLGYQRLTAEKAIRQALAETNGTDLSLEELIKRALRVVSSK